MTRHAASPDDVGQRVDLFLSSQLSAERLGQVSRAQVQRLVAQGCVYVRRGGALAPIHRPSARIQAGDELEVRWPAPEPLKLEPLNIPLDILYEDDDLLALNKPAGLSVHPGAGRSHGTVVQALLWHCRDLSGIGGVQRPGIVHRLDRATSGVLVVAKHDAAHLGLSGQFARREVEKEYLAVVYGHPAKASLRIETPYGRHPTDRKRFSGRGGTRRAITEYTVQSFGPELSVLTVRIHTGRTHQIRVHLAELGHPVVGDEIYGKGRSARLRDLTLRQFVREMKRHALHAGRLCLRHPMSDVPLSFEAPLPEDLSALCRLWVERSR